jgi:hypothetical protein
MTLYDLQRFFLKKNEEEMNQFMRIAQAQLKSTYKFAPQRAAVAAKMYSRWINRKADEAGQTKE